MSIPMDTTWSIEAHTTAKHEILRRYLGAWFAILGTSYPRIVYIDGFCGPGKYDGGESGSPIIALREALKHSNRLRISQVTFLFVDERADRISHLQSELSAFPIPDNFHLILQTGQFDIELSQLLDFVDSGNLRLAPTFSFIDPFGFKGIPFSLVRRLLANPNTEVFVSVMVNSINRFLEHPDPLTQKHIVELFGTDEALNIAATSTNRMADLRMLYQQQLLSSAKYVRYFEMRNNSNLPIYYLFFAGNHPLGHKKVKEAFWRVDKSSGFCFSDATNPNQLVLFELDETPKLANNIQNSFRGERVTVRQIQNYVEEQTAFLAPHMKKALKQLEGEKQIQVEEFKIDSKKRHGKTFPEGVIVHF